MSILNRPYFCDEEAAHTFLEGIVWTQGTECPHCGGVGTAYKIATNPAKRVRYGLWKCKDCCKQFTCKVGTVFEHARSLEISLKAAWFLSRHIREAMREFHFAGQLGGEGEFVESDETFVGSTEKNKHKRVRTIQTGGFGQKEPVFSLVERGGKVRSHHVPSLNAATLRPILEEQLNKKTAFMTDRKGPYRILGPTYASHGVVNHRIANTSGAKLTRTRLKAFSRSSSAA